MADERSRVDDLLAEMTTAEKAGQLTQYFYFGFMRGADDGPTIGGIRPSPEAVEAAMGRGEVGLAACSSPIRRRPTACSGSRSKATGSASRCCSAST